MREGVRKQTRGKEKTLNLETFPQISRRWLQHCNFSVCLASHVISPAQTGMPSNQYLDTASTAEPPGADAGSSQDPLGRTPDSSRQERQRLAARHGIQPQLGTAVEPLSPLGVVGGEGR